MTEEEMETLVDNLKLSQFPRKCECGSVHFDLKREDPSKNPIGIRHFVKCVDCGDLTEVTDYELW